MIKLNRLDCPNLPALQGGDYKEVTNKRALSESSFGKCMYCESKILHIDYGDVEHFKPKSVFPEFEFEWSNLGLACTKCNRSTGKGDNYNDDLIDPYSVDPAPHLMVGGSFLFPKDDSVRGLVTIDLVKLNRPQLLQRRTEHLDRMRSLISIYLRTNDPVTKEAIKDLLLEESTSDKEYSLNVSYLLENAGIKAPEVVGA